MKIILVCLFLLHTACVMDKKGMYKEIYISNNSLDSICIISDKPYYLDSNISPIAPAINTLFNIPPKYQNQTLLTAWSSNGIANYINTVTDKKYLCFFIIKKNVFQTKPWDSVVANKIYYTKKIIFSDNVDNNSNLIITYP
jgi:hypothetical protein